MSFSIDFAVHRAKILVDNVKKNKEKIIEFMYQVGTFFVKTTTKQTKVTELL